MSTRQITRALAASPADIAHKVTLDIRGISVTGKTDCGRQVNQTTWHRIYDADVAFTTKCRRCFS